VRRATEHFKDSGIAPRKRNFTATRFAVNPVAQLREIGSNETRALGNRSRRRGRQGQIATRSPAPCQSRHRRDRRLSQRSDHPARRKGTAAAGVPSETADGAHDCARRAVPPARRSISGCAQRAGRGV
jgi:hypothetical protein